MTAFLLLVIIIASGVFIGIPYLRVRGAPKRVPAQSETAELRSELDRVLGTIRDIENDRDMGKISGPDYAEMSARYREKAVALIQRIEASGKPDARR